MVTFEANLIMFIIGFILMVLTFIVYQNNNIHIVIRRIALAIFCIGFLMFCAYGTRTLELMPIDKIKELLR